MQQSRYIFVKIEFEISVIDVYKQQIIKQTRLKNKKNVGCFNLDLVVVELLRQHLLQQSCLVEK